MKNEDFIRNSPVAGFYNDCRAAFEKGNARLPVERIINSHCHVYADKIAPRAVRAIDGFYEGLPVTPLDGTVGTMLREGEACSISRFVVHSVATKPAQVSAINAYFSSLRREDRAFGGPGKLITLGALHPESDHPEKDFEELVQFGLQGVKLHPDIQHFRADDQKAMRIFEMCEAAGLPVLVHTGDFRYDYSNPGRIAAVLRRFPDLKMIGAHLGGWSVWEEAAALLADFPNYAVDTSSCFYWLQPQKALEMIRAYGSARVMFGTDYPMWPAQAELEYLRRLDLDADELEDICWRTCESIFKDRGREAQKVSA